MHQARRHATWLPAIALWISGCVANPTKLVDLDTGIDSVMDDGGALSDASELDAGLNDGNLDAGCFDCPECRQENDCTGKPDARVHCSAAGACVGCESNAQCTQPENPRCEAFACTGCMTASDCALFPTTPACAASGACVECTTASAERCMQAGKVCKSGGNTCVACNANAECKQAAASRCVDNACAGCMANTDCSQIAGKPVCHQGTCVACTPETEATDCGDTACDPQTLTCTTTKRNSLAACRACKSDSECLMDHKCVAVPFGAMDTGSYCMRAKAAGCMNPYRTMLTAASRSGAASADYCSHNTQVTTCQAVTALTSDTPCTTETVEKDCGPGALCANVGGAPNRCTYSCANNLDCPSNAPCSDASSAAPYCGG